MRALTLGIGFFLIFSTAYAQSKDASGTTSSRATTTTLSGTLVAVNESAGTVTIQPIVTTEKPVTLSLGLQTRFVRKNQIAKATDFETGESVVARYRDGKPVLLRELWDAASFLSGEKARTKISTGKINRFMADGIELRSEDGTLLQFRITSKTRFIKSGRPATATDFPVGATIAIKPRGLPSGGVMATIIAESGTQVEATYQDGLSRWGGTIRSVEKMPAALTIERVDGAVRRVLLANSLEIRASRKKSDLSVLTPGVTVTLYLTKASLNNDPRTADRITITTGKAQTPPFPGLPQTPK